MYGHALRFANRFTHPLSLFLTWAYTHKHYCKNTTSSRLPVHHVHFSPSSPTLLHLTLPIRTRLGAQSVPKEVLHASSMLTVSWVWHRGSGSLFHNLSLHAQAGLTCVAYFTKTHTHTHKTAIHPPVQAQVSPLFYILYDTKIDIQYTTGWTKALPSRDWSQQSPFLKTGKVSMYVTHLVAHQEEVFS